MLLGLGLEGEALGDSIEAKGFFLIDFTFEETNAVNLLTLDSPMNKLFGDAFLSVGFLFFTIKPSSLAWISSLTPISRHYSRSLLSSFSSAV